MPLRRCEKVANAANSSRSQFVALGWQLSVEMLPSEMPPECRSIRARLNGRLNAASYLK
jgi:hypothetical protein